MAEWDAAYINDLPDSAFAVILPGGEKDEDGKTTSRSLRKLPHHNAEGAVDFPHLLNALSREPQADMPEAMHERAQSHLQGHRESDRAESDDELVTTSLGDAEIEVRNLEKREIGAYIAPWDEVVDTPIGLESFQRGSFAHVDPKKVVLRLEHQDPPAGRGLSIEERARGAYMTFRVSKTSRGDEILTLAADGVTPHVSVGYAPATSKFEMQARGNKRVTALTRVDLREVSTTWKPYYQRATVDYVRSMEETPVDTPAVTEAPAPNVTVSIGADAFAPLAEMVERGQKELAEQFTSKMNEIEERARTNIEVPAPSPIKVAPHLWLQRRAFDLYPSRDDHMPEALRALDDVTVAQNTGLFTNAIVNEIITDIDKRRPFLQSTRQVDPPPPNTMSIQLPKVTQHTEFDVQATEKTAVATRDLRTTPVTYDMVTIAGAVDVSIQFIKRGTPTAMQVLLDDMEAQYAQKAEVEALDALLDEADVVEGGNLDPDDLLLGASFTNSFAELNEGPDTIWLSTPALARFIDAKADTSNTPLYGSIQANATAAGGISGTISGLRAVHVPQLTRVSAIVGPSRGFVWAEQYPIRLEADNPELAGRDIGLVGFLWFMPRYPAAFTSYGLSAS